MDQVENFSDFDMVLLSETWLKPNHSYDMNIPGYNSVCLSRLCTNIKARRGSGGLMCYIRNGIKEGIEILNPKCNNFSEDRLWIKLCANYFSFEKDLYLCLVYISPETSTHQSSGNNIWNLLEEEISNFSIRGHILLTRDFNARTGLLPDYVSHDSDLHVPLPPDYSVDIPISRKSEDHTVNNYGRELLDVCVAGWLHLINGRIRPDTSKGAFTCFSPRGTSVVDYTITSEDFLKYVSHFQVGDISIFSDHCPLHLHLSTQPSSSIRIARLNMLSNDLLQDVQERMGNHQEAEPESPVQVLHTSEEKLAEIFSNQDFRNKIASLETELSVSPATECTHKFICLLQEALKVKIKKKGKNKNTFPKNMWFDKQCKEKKKDFKKAAKRAKENVNNLVLRELMWKERRIYKSLIKKKKRQSISKLHSELMEFKTKNPREFWIKIASVTKQESSTDIPITLEELRIIIF